MNQALPSVEEAQRPPDRMVYFATGAAQEVAPDLERLCVGRNGMRLRVVVPARHVREVEQLASFKRNEILTYRPATVPLLWLRLWGFLGFCRRVEIVCLSARERYRFLKLLALTLRGRVIFSPVNGRRVPLGPWALLVIRVRRTLDAREQARETLPIGIIGSASGFYLMKIIEVLRARYPAAALHGLLLPEGAASSAPLFDATRVVRPGWLAAGREALRLAGARRAYQRWVIPCTNESYHLLKLLAFLWPLTRRQIYNELGDGFAVRDVRTLWAHCGWRLRDHLSFQVVAGTAGRSLPKRVVHLALYAMRLLAGAGLLCALRMRGILGRWKADPQEARAREAGESSGDEATKTVGVGLSRRAAVAAELPRKSSGTSRIQ